ncbi:tetratricopeptide repeat protein [Massilia sp. 9I]|uniref:O-linked N-acetylglucosamine transferase, SPINDLY family protein n=1 Tax=Massilia sp. 9I TaxID=2653152 RepID=UPI0012F3C1A8|nr:tetratricopeptide repeat protein [Massilia sp. 9I]VXC67540.1 Tetratricopeptide repeat family protein [Massilia sp. 9I]
MPPPTDELQTLADEALHAGLNELEAGQFEQAGALFRAVLELQPARAEAHFGLGMLERRAGDAGAAIPHFANALQAAPEEASYWIVYLDALMEARQYATARELIALGRSQGLEGPEIDAFEQQLDRQGAPSDQRIEAAGALYAKGKKEAAGRLARKLTEEFPQHPFGWKLLSGVLYSQRDFPEALAAMSKAAQYGPDDAETLCNLGLMLRGAGQLDDAKSVLERAAALDPDNINAYNHLAATLQEMGRPTEALAAVTAALAIDPEDTGALASIAVILDNLGRADEAVDAYRRLLAREPNHSNAYGNMLFCMSHMERFTPDELFAEHVRFGQNFASRIKAARKWTNTREPGRPIRIGFVSGDLRNHAVASFIAPMFRELGKRPGLALHAYYTHPVQDDTTAALRSHVAHWREVSALEDDALEALIRKDGIDILVDMSGHTAYNRLHVFARKPAPIQVSWLGYPGTTGLATMDYYLYDRHLLPRGEYEHLFTEALVRIPVGSAFEPNAEAPEVTPLPALANGYLTFGSFNRLSKISREVIALWSELLRALPNARLVVAGMPVEGGGHEQLASWLQEEGIDAARTSFHPRTGTPDYLAMHGGIDICLDTFPYTGGTTTLFALYMGVPTLSLAGRSIAGRQTAALLAHHGLQDFVARDGADFVAKGIAASKDLAALAQVRATLRKRSPLWTPAGVGAIVDAFEYALRHMWERWCAGLPAEGFEVPAQHPLEPD